MDQLEKKFESAKEREGKRRERRKVWEEVNGGADVNGVGKRGQGKVGGGEGEGEGDGEGEGQWEDVEDMSGDGDEEMQGVDAAVAAIEPTEPVQVAGQKLEVVDHTASLNDADIDEIT